MLVGHKTLDEKNKLVAFTCIIKNHNRKTIERFDATELLPLVDHDEKTIIDLLKAQRCEPLTPEEGRMLELYRKQHGQSFDITPEEFEYAVKNGLTLEQLCKLRARWTYLQNYEVKL